MNGNDNIGRPIDVEHFKEINKESREKIVKGELLPWQVDYPLQFKLSEVQIKYGGDKLVKEFEKLQSEAKAKRGIK
jgi:hypothetical protein